MDTLFIKNNIELLVRKAAETQKSEDALRFSQAALNLAHVAGTFDMILNRK